MTAYVKREYTVRFLTPAFLGNAEQAGEWRTPPFKALLRQWWRVAVAKDHGYDHHRIREPEGRLFGNAWLDANSEDCAAGRKTGHCRSAVRLRLEAKDGVLAWTQGTQTGVAPMRDGLDTSYSWFGLIKRKDRITKQSSPDRTGMKPDAAEGERILKLAFPEDRKAEIETTLRLIHTFGQIGSRARTGWGAIHIEGMTSLGSAELRALARESQDCLDLDWAHALGSDAEGPWVWESPNEFKDWASALSKVAGLRKDVRTSLKGQIDMRPLLGFADAGRMPSPLRWRVFCASDSDALQVRVFALPHRIPADGKKDGSNRHATSAWSTVTQVLDHSWLRRVD